VSAWHTGDHVVVAAVSEDEEGADPRVAADAGDDSDDDSEAASDRNDSDESGDDSGKKSGN
jgi:hypothetical protein